MHTPPRATLAHLPTPLERLPRLSEYLGVDLWIKRDDQTGLAFGGNKTRKLEYLVADAQAQGADTLITTGAIQSNHCRQTAAAAARCGLHAIVVVGGAQEPQPTGNLLLDTLLGARVVYTEPESRESTMAREAQACRERGNRPYVIPLGGSNALGAAAYYQASAELNGQLVDQSLEPFETVVFASSSGGTHAGLVVGARQHAWPTNVLGISVDYPREELESNVFGLTRDCCELLQLDCSISAKDVVACDDYMKPGYGVMTPGEEDAIKLFAQKEGVLLDPVYTGRAAFGLIDLVRVGKIAPDSRVLFWHTGGAPALFAYTFD